MAIIREKQNFQIGTIGVARASEAGRITGQAISQSANKIGGMLFEKASDEAQKAGLELGQSVDREQIIAINPQTGEPEAYDPPEGMGTIAADAYQRVVMNRFQRSIEDEIQNKARELSVQYEDNPNGVALYTEAMSNYISSMTNVAQDEFKGYISDVGTSYLNSTRTSMAAAQLRRERAAAARAQRAAVAEGLANFEALIARSGADVLSEGGIGDVLSSQVQTSIEDGQTSGLFDEVDISNLNKAQRGSLARGLLQNIANDYSIPMSDLKAIQAVFNQQNPNLIPEGYPELQAVTLQIARNPDEFRDMEAFSDGLYGELITYRQSLIDQNVAAIQLQDKQRALRIGGENVHLPSDFRATFDRLDSDSGFAFILDEYNKFEVPNLLGPEIPQPETAAAATKAREDFVRNAFTEFANQSFVGFSTFQIKQMQNAVTYGELENLPPVTRNFVQNLINLEAQTDVPVIELYNDLAQEYSQTGGAIVDARNAREAERLEDAEEKAIKLEALLEGQSLTAESDAFRFTLLGHIQNGDLPSAIQAIVRNDTNLARRQTAAINDGKSELESVLSTAREASFNTSINALAARAVEGLTQEKTDLLINALSDPNIDAQENAIQQLLNDRVISETSALSLLAAIRAGETLNKTSDVFNLLDRAFDSHRSGGARGADLIQKSQANDLEQDIQGLLLDMNFSGNSNLAEDVEPMLQQLGELNPTSAENLRKGLNKVTAELGIADFFSSSNLTGNQTILAKMILDGFPQDKIAQESARLGTQLSEEQISNLEEVREAALRTDNAGEIITTRFNALEKVRSQNEAAQLALEEQRKATSEIFSGTASPTDSFSQESLQKFINERFSDVSVFDLLTNFEIASQNPQALQYALAASVLPTDTVNVFEQFGKGNLLRLNGSQMEAVLSNWSNIRTVTRNGVRVQNPSVDAIAAESRAVLDYLVGATTISGTRDANVIVEAYDQYRLNSTDPQFKDKDTMKARLGAESLEEFIINQFGDEPYDANMYQVAQNVTLSMYYTGASTGEIEEAVSRQLETSFPNGEGIVYGDNMAVSTEQALSKTVPYHQDIFVEVLADRIHSATGAASIQIGERTLLQSLFGKDEVVFGAEPDPTSTADILTDPQGMLEAAGKALPIISNLVSEEDQATVATSPEREQTTIATRFFLRPAPQRSDTDAVGYFVYKMPSVRGAANELVYETLKVGADTQRRPMIMYTNDPVFIRRSNAATEELKAEFALRGELSRNYELTALDRAISGSLLDPREPEHEVSTPGLDPAKPYLASIKDFFVTTVFSTPYRD